MNRQVRSRSLQDLQAEGCVHIESDSFVGVGRGAITYVGGAPERSQPGTTRERGQEVDGRDLGQTLLLRLRVLAEAFKPGVRRSELCELAASEL